MHEHAAEHYDRPAAGVAGLALGDLALALDEIVLRHQLGRRAEHGGFYQAVADGTNEKYGLKVTIVQGGPGRQSSCSAAARSTSTWAAT